MVDFTTPNLCGASEEFNKLSSQFSGIKNSLQGQLEGEIDALKSELTASLAVLEADIKGLIPELPSIPDVSFISEIQNLAALPSGGLSSLSALANIQSQFGSALSGAGFSLDSLVGDATAAFSGGVDLCGGGLPNFVIGPNGLPTLKPEDAGMPDTDPKRLDEDDDIEGEAASSLLTPAAEISSVNALIEAAASNAASNYQEQTAKIRAVISSETGEISNKTKEEFDKADAVAETAAIKAKVPANPQTAKVKDAVLTNKTLPPKEPVIKPVDLTADEQAEIEALRVLQDDISDLENEMMSEFERLSHLLLKYTKKFPQNITADGKRKVILDRKKRASPPGRTAPRPLTIKGFHEYYRGQVNAKKKSFKELNIRIDRRRDLILTGKSTERALREGTSLVRTTSAQNVKTLEDIFERIKNERPINTVLTLLELIDFLDDAYVLAEKTYTVALDAPASSGLTIVSVRDLGFVKQFRLSDGREVSENQLAGLGLSPS